MSGEAFRLTNSGFGRRKAEDLLKVELNPQPRPGIRQEYAGHPGVEMPFPRTAILSWSNTQMDQTAAAQQAGLNDLRCIRALTGL